MPAPISQFGYQVNDLEITFTSLSLNVDVDTTYLWDFGDGNTSAEENPIHTYLAPAFYNVKLTVTNLDASTSESIVLINISGTQNPEIFNDIPSMVDLYSPTEIIGTVRNHQQKEFLISKWQAYLQPLVVDKIVTIENTYNPNAYSPLANSLIAKLVVIEIIMAEASAFLLKTAVDGNGGSSASSGSGSTTVNGSIKSIETGPTKVERYENKDVSSASEKSANLAKTYQNLITQGGVLDQLKDSACQESKRIDVYLPMCGPLPASNKGFGVTCKNEGQGYNANPFGITDRMI
jgi:PKD repeat protein